MKIVAKWTVIAVFAFQATGATWFAHIATCCASPNPTAACPCGQNCPRLVLVGKKLVAVYGSPACPQPRPYRHDPLTCDACQTLLHASATVTIPSALEACQEVCLARPDAPNEPVLEATLSAAAPRGPPESAL